MLWEPGQAEPDGWIRAHSPQGFRRRKFGDPRLEYLDGEEPDWMRQLCTPEEAAACFDFFLFVGVDK